VNLEAGSPFPNLFSVPLQKNQLLNIVSKEIIFLNNSYQTYLK